MPQKAEDDVADRRALRNGHPVELQALLGEQTLEEARVARESRQNFAEIRAEGGIPDGNESRGRPCRSTRTSACRSEGLALVK
jgi:hypothetical protein